MKQLSIFLYSFLLFAQGLLSQSLQHVETLSASDVAIVNVDDRFDVVTLPKSDLPTDINFLGSPQLPVKAISILLPRGATVDDITIQMESEILVSDNIYIYPLQAPVFANFSDPPAFVEPNPIIYGSNNPFPETPLMRYENNAYREFNFVTIFYTPFRYLPLQKKLFAYTKLSFTIEHSIKNRDDVFKLRPYDSEDEFVTQRVRKFVSNSRQMEEFYPVSMQKLDDYQQTKRDNIIGRKFIPSPLPSLQGSPVKYIIITDNVDTEGNIIGEFLSIFQSFAEWKTRTGQPAKVVSVSDIRQNYAGIDIPEQIREFIKDAHKYWGTEYILLGGSASIVPVRYVAQGDQHNWSLIHSIPSDLYYSDIIHPEFGYNHNWNTSGDYIFGEGSDRCDFHPDIFVGRAPVDTDEELSLFIHKNQTYDRPVVGSASGWLHKQLNIGGIIKSEPWPTNEIYKTSLGLPMFWYIEHNFPSDMIYYTMLEYWNPPPYTQWNLAYNLMEAPVSKSAVMNKIQEKPGIIFHMDHSGPHKLGLNMLSTNASGIYPSDFSSLPIDNKFPIFLSGGCHTAPINQKSYIGEQWLTSPGGGVAYMGASFDYISANGYKFYQDFFYHLNTFWDNTTIGISKTWNSPNSWEYIYSQKLVQLLGDPALKIRQYSPLINNVTHISQTTTGLSEFTVTIDNCFVDLATVSLYKENEVLAYGIVSNPTGTIRFDINPNTMGSMKLTVHSIATPTYEANITVVPNPNANLYVEEYSILDENGNGKIEPGENVEVIAKIKNSGLQTATNITGTISCSAESLNNNHFQIIQGVANYPNITPNQSGINQQRFKFKAPVQDFTAPSKGFALILRLNSQQGIFEDQRFLEIVPVKLELGKRTTKINGIENNTFTNGDIVELTFELNNTTNMVAGNVTALLTTSLASNVAQILNATSSVGNIQPFGTAISSEVMRIRIGSGYNGQSLPFVLSISNDMGSVFPYTFELNEPLPSKISNFDFTPFQSTIELQWKKPSGTNFIGYNIYRSEQENGIYSRINNFLIKGSSKYTDTNLEFNKRYFYKISAVSSTGNERGLSLIDVYTAWTTIKLSEGFPVMPENSTGTLSSPIIMDINNDGKKEIFVNLNNSTQGILLALSYNGSEYFDTDNNSNTITGYAATDKTFWNSSAIDDIDADGINELVSITRSNGKIKGFKIPDNNSGLPEIFFDRSLGTGDLGMAYPVISNIDNSADGSKEMLFLTEHQEIFVFSNDRKLIWSQKVENTGDSYGELAVGDIDGDGTMEIVAGFKKVNGNNQGGLYIWNHDGTPYSTIPFKTFQAGMRADGGVVLANLDNDDDLEIIMLTQIGGSFCDLRAYKKNGNNLFIYSGINSSADFIPRVSVGDLNLDGRLEIIVGSKDKLYVFNNLGSLLPGFPVLVGDTYNFTPILADIDEDPYIEIIVNSTSGAIRAFKHTAEEVYGWRLQHPFGNLHGAPCIDDLDGDGKSEIVAVCGTTGQIFSWKTLGDADKIEWGSNRANPQNTGTYTDRCKYSITNNIVLSGMNEHNWDFSRTIKGDIIINNGAKLTINTTIYFVNEAKIIVKPGGKLVLDGAKLTNSCGSLWKGIEMHGIKTSSQTPANQPVVELKNGAVIENALCGVFVGNPANAGNAGGGILYALDAEFKNCKNGIKMDPYTPTNLSYIYKCRFETDSNYDNISQGSDAAVLLWDVKNVNVKGNTFINSAPTAFQPTKRGNGLLIKGATCFVEPHGPAAQTKNSFSNLNNAIYIVSSTTISDVIILDNVFTNNQVAVRTSGSYKGKAVKNSISLPTVSSFGFLASNSNNFKIEENIITGSATGIGIYVENSMGSPEIYKNIISNTGAGILVSNNPGLKVTCNELSNNTQQISITYNGSSNYLGSMELAAGNKFLPECAGTHTEIEVYGNTNSILYYHYNSSIEQPLCLDGLVTLFPTNNHNACPSRNTNSEIPSEDILMGLKNTINEQEELLALMVDGGNTQKTVNAIETVQEGQEINLMSDLLDKSPFLSEEALVKTAVEEDVLPAIIVANVLEANPQAAKSVEVQTALDNRANPMPDYLRQLIDQGLDVVSAKEELEMALGENKMLKEQVLSDIITAYLNDQTTDRSADAEALMLAENSPSYDYLMVNRYLSTNRMTEAQTLFNAMPGKYSFSDAQMVEYNQMAQIVAIHVALGHANYFELTAEQKNQLYLLANDGATRAGALARGILVLVDRAEFPVPEITIPEGGNKNQRIPMEEKPIFSFNVQPNPANDYFVVEYNLATKEFETAELRLFNNQGKQVYQQKLTKQAFQLLITTEQFEPGIYLCRLYKDSKEVGANPLVIKPNQLTNPQAVVQAEQLLEGQQFFLVYPNPATVDVTVCSSRTENCTIEVYDERGQVVNRLSKVAATNTINTHSLKPGVYHVRLVENGKVVETVKLVVQ
jgi:parallel beta-helix repeat protein